MTTTSGDTAGKPSALARTLARLRADPAALAALRRGLGREPADSPEAWPWTLPLVGHDDRLGGGHEAAVHHTLTLYALHQQSQTRSMHAPEGGTLGRACGRLAAVHASREAVARRFLAAATADTTREVVVHLRGLITLLRQREIPLNYEQLHRDLRRWPWPDARSAVRHRWGRDFYQPRPTDPEHADTPANFPTPEGGP